MLVHAEEVKPHVQISTLKDTADWHTCTLSLLSVERPHLLLRPAQDASNEQNAGFDLSRLLRLKSFSGLITLVYASFQNRMEGKKGKRGKKVTDNSPWLWQIHRHCWLNDKLSMYKYVTYQQVWKMVEMLYICREKKVYTRPPWSPWSSWASRATGHPWNTWHSWKQCCGPCRSPRTPWTTRTSRHTRPSRYKVKIT